MRLVLLAALALLAPAVVALPMTTPAPIPEVVTGFTIAPLVPMAAPTAIAFGPDGDLYATVATGQVLRVELTSTPAGPVASDVTVHADGFSLPLGLWWVGDVLYVADSHEGEESGRTDGRVSAIVDGRTVTVVDGLPNGRHNANHLRLGPDGRLYVANGNPNDNGIDGGDSDIFPYSGAILSFDPRRVISDAAILHWRDADGAPIPDALLASHPRNADFAEKIDVLAYGFRNQFGVAFAADGTAYTAMNGADIPSSQDAFYKIEPGTFYGFPFCYNEGTPGGTDAVVVNNPLYPAYDCTSVPAADALLGWHICATGLDIAPASWPAGFAGSAFVGECGPFFPEPHAQGFSTHDVGHKVAHVELDAQGDAVAVRDFVTGLALPTDVLFGPDDAMYVADAGGILRIAPLL